jgi:hypothetical protein
MMEREVMAGSSAIAKDTQKGCLDAGLTRECVGIGGDIPRISTIAASYRDGSKKYGSQEMP